LQEWAGENILLRADHFFWLLGAAMQKSLEGLLRSLTYSILLGLWQPHFPNKLEVIAKICSPRSHINAHSAWSRKELKDILCRLAPISGVKMFFLVDALDEREPQDKLGELAKEILWISQLPNVKLCVSHRPWAVFTRKFEHASTLQLHLMTLGDMEIYVRGRLTAVEEETGWSTDFGSQTQAAERFVHKVAHDAEGVFLWVELVVKAICSEMRKGKQLHQLDDIYLEFPTDLDNYFQNLIFDRIGRSRQNIKDTAAALRLAVAINTSEQGREKFPFARSFINFWLLSNDHLWPGFSWQDYERIVMPGFGPMLSHTASYLEETCKDLLVLNTCNQNVDFIHRTAFDFLTDKKTHAALEENVPGHFSDPNFISNLAELRCMFIVRQDRIYRDDMLSSLDIILQNYQTSSHLDVYVPWLLTCESLTISQLQKHRADALRRPEYHLPGMPARCVKAGLGRVVLEMYKHKPHEAVVRESTHSKCTHADLLGHLLRVTTIIESQHPDPALFRHVLEIGCDANALLGIWPNFWCQRHLFGLGYMSLDGSLGRFDDLERCSRTAWQAWLGEAYLLTQRLVSAESSEQISERLEERKFWFGVLVDLQLRHGADPRTTICVTDHDPYSTDGNTCILVTFEDLLAHIVPLESMMQLHDLRILCCDRRISQTLRRNQKKRAMRSLLISEQNLATGFPVDRMPRPTKEHVWKNFLYSVTGAASVIADYDCKGCGCSKIGEGVYGRPMYQAAFVVWCIDCHSLSKLCLKCARRPDKVQSLISSCNDSIVPLAAQDDGHTSVAFVWEGQLIHFTNRDDMTDLLHEQYSLEKAIDALKRWYTRNPIEPDLTFKDVIRGITTLPHSSGRYQASEDDGAEGALADLHPRNATKRSMSGTEESEVASKRHTAVHMPIATSGGS
jgi:hypothetical protein